jgi:hypothetical protein
MTISRMQNPKQLKGNGGILTLADAKRMAPPGESLAYINKDEAKLLKSRGGAGEDINGTGIKSYFLKKIFKKAKRAVKKVVKSPIGKAALTGAALYYAPAMFGGTTGFGAGSTYGNLFSGARAGLGSFLKPGSGGTGFFSNMLGKAGNYIKTNPGKSALLGLGAAGIAAPFLMGGDEEEVEEDTPFSQTPDSIASIVNMARNQDPSLRFLPKPKFVDNFYAADGGLARMGYNQGESVLSKEQMSMINDMKNKGMDMSTIESVTGATAQQITNYLSSLNQKQEGGIMDLGGLEKDYREGGFVPLGEEERADDVPARLSKNEFVFTADAVRAAGGGDIDQGAEVMQNMMDNLEAGGTISEESQGMNPAQEMFDQSQMLENRIA